jgi:hypothetical protein
LSCSSRAKTVELWDVAEEGAHRYDAFLYNVDSGTVFRRGTTEVVAEMIQCYFDQADDEEFEAALQAGYRAAGVERAAAGKKVAKAGKKAAAKKVAKKVAKTAAVVKTAAKARGR